MSKGGKMKDLDGLKLVTHKKVEALAQDLNITEGQDVSAPPIAIISDGTDAGTVLMIHGQVVPFHHMDFYCSRDEEFSSCSMSVTVKETDSNGLEIRKTMTLRKSDN